MMIKQCNHYIDHYIYISIYRYKFPEVQCTRCVLGVRETPDLALPCRETDIDALHERWQPWSGPLVVRARTWESPKGIREGSLDLVFPVVQMVKSRPAVQETWVRSLGWEDPLEKGMATHPSTLAWRIPWTEEPGGLLHCLPEYAQTHAHWVDDAI